MALLGIDLGTSGVKALLLDPDGTVLAEHDAALPLHVPRPGWSEQEPSDWWQGVVTAVRGLAGRRSDAIDGIALSGQMHGATLLDADGAVLRPCILWNDQRSAPQSAEITARVGLANLRRWVANPALAGFTAPKLLWVREHELEVFRRIATVLLPKDYINFRLTGIRATDPSDASGTLLFDVAHRRWSAEMPVALGLPEGILPPVRESSEIIGHLAAEAAAELGLPSGIPVAAGGADNACAALAGGVVADGQALLSLGTSGTLLAPTADPRQDPDLRLHTFCHAVPATWYLMGVVLSAGASLSWYRDTMAGDEPYASLLDHAALMPAGAEGLLFLPYLSGERTPHADPDARGVFFGLSLHHTRAHLTRAVLEGITFALADAATIMRDLGLRLPSIRLTGGGARHAFWQQLAADILGAPMARVSAGPALGAAFLAGIGAGVFGSIEEAVRLVRTAEETRPNPETIDVYRRYHAMFDRLYPALRPKFEELAGLEAAESKQSVARA
ncbi:MAG TPA: xylulokinase [Chloroflexota bacterium]|nr:xylulokinase [Chloroflexota bacterium]